MKWTMIPLTVDAAILHSLQAVHNFNLMLSTAALPQEAHTSSSASTLSIAVYGNANSYVEEPLTVDVNLLIIIGWLCRGVVI